MNGRLTATRTAALATTAGASLVGGWLFLRFTGLGGLTLIDLLRTGLVVITGFWLVWGAYPVQLGLLDRSERTGDQPIRRPRGKTVVLVPIYNEDPIATFSRIAAMNLSLIDLGMEERFHFVVLSDTQNLEIASREALWFARLMREPRSTGRIFYRRRSKNIGRKAGNIEDFIAQSGAAYDYALVLDADSLMEGEAMVRLATRLDEDTQLGLLQTVPRIIGARTVFGRVMQFAAGYLSPIYAAGAAKLQGNEGPYWGHNAIVRLSAFAGSCGLPKLSGRPPFGGHILSHDYVEAALLSRSGWKVQVDLSITGTYEEGPENLIEYAKRDRRWCQGNLQHSRLLAAPRLKFWSRLTFLQGIMAYLASPLWLVLLAASIIAASFPNMPPVLSFVGATDQGIWALSLAVVTVLVLPKILILLAGAVTGRNKRFGGTLRAGTSLLAEIVFSTCLAPVMLLLQSWAVVQVLLGLDGGWPATRRDNDQVSMKDAFAGTWWITCIGIIVLTITLVWAPATLVWVLPAMLPAIAAPALISWSSRGFSHAWLFLSEAEAAPSPIVLSQRAIAADWHPKTGLSTPLDAGVPARVLA